MCTDVDESEEKDLRCDSKTTCHAQQTFPIDDEAQHRPNQPRDPAAFFAKGSSLDARPSQLRRMTTPIAIGSSTTIRSGLAMAQALVVRPLAKRGTVKGMQTTVPTEAKSMNAAVKPRSPFALSTNIGTKGAHGAMPSKISPMA